MSELMKHSRAILAGAFGVLVLVAIVGVAPRSENSAPRPSPDQQHVSEGFASAKVASWRAPQDAAQSSPNATAETHPKMKADASTSTLAIAPEPAAIRRLLQETSTDWRNDANAIISVLLQLCPAGRLTAHDTAQREGPESFGAASCTHLMATFDAEEMALFLKRASGLMGWDAELARINERSRTVGMPRSRLEAFARNAESLLAAAWLAQALSAPEQESQQLFADYADPQGTIRSADRRRNVARAAVLGWHCQRSGGCAALSPLVIDYCLSTARPVCNVHWDADQTIMANLPPVDQQAYLRLRDRISDLVRNGGG